MSEKVETMTQEMYLKTEKALGNSIHKIPYEVMLIDLDDIDPRPDWQPRRVTDPNRLYNSICTIGMSTPPKVYLDTKDNYNALTARHRLASLIKMRDERMERFNFHEFDKGILCHVYKNLTPDQILMLRSDEGRMQAPLAGKIEAFNALLPHFESGKPDRAIMMGNWSIYVDSCVSPSKKGELYESFQGCKEGKDFYEAINNATRIHQQRFRLLYKCPILVRNAWMLGEEGKNFDYAALSAVTTNDVSTFKGHIKITDPDLKKVLEGVKVDNDADAASGYTLGYRTKIGPIGLAAFEKVVKAKFEKLSGTVVEQKAMTRQERDAYQTNSKSGIQSQIFGAINGNTGCRAALDSTLTALARFETAYNIDKETFNDIIVAITLRKEKLFESDRIQILQIIKNGKKEPKAQEPKVQEPKVQEPKVQKSKVKV